MGSAPKCPTLLLVEDSPDDAFLFGRALKKTGLDYSLHHAVNGKEAVQYLELALSPHGPDIPDIPDIVFLDLCMPAMNGFEVLKWIKLRDFPRSMRVVVLSSFANLEDLPRAAESGMTEYILKPVEVDDLVLLLSGAAMRGMKHEYAPDRKFSA